MIAGKDKGKSGVVFHSFPQRENVVIEGVNVMKRHQKGGRGTKGQIVERPMPLHVSNVMLVEGKKPVRVGYKVEDGKKVRISRKTGKAL